MELSTALPVLGISATEPTDFTPIVVTPRIPTWKSRAGRGAAFRAARSYPILMHPRGSNGYPSGHRNRHWCLCSDHWHSWRDNLVSPQAPGRV
ncbi:MAG: hypothetical protein OXC07_11265 [Kistimonas sp.]|nr:hypothetical protein [Kistimonas sp.]